MLGGFEGAETPRTPLHKAEWIEFSDFAGFVDSFTAIFYKKLGILPQKNRRFRELGGIVLDFSFSFMTSVDGDK